MLETHAYIFHVLHVDAAHACHMHVWSTHSHFGLVDLAVTTLTAAAAAAAGLLEHVFNQSVNGLCLLSIRWEPPAPQLLRDLHVPHPLHLITYCFLIRWTAGPATAKVA
jgi:hypothetical protein